MTLSHPVQYLAYRAHPLPDSFQLLAADRTPSIRRERLTAQIMIFLGHIHLTNL